MIEAGSLSKEVRRISRAFRLTVALRRRLAARDVSAFLAFALPASSEAYGRLTALVPKVKFASPLSAVKGIADWIREARLWYSPDFVTPGPHRVRMLLMLLIYRCILGLTYLYGALHIELLITLS